MEGNAEAVSAKSLDDKLDTLRAARRVPAQGPPRQGHLRRQGRNLRSRVRTYFRGGDERSQVAFLVQRVGDFETWSRPPKRKR
jgi:hypothetical protein